MKEHNWDFKEQETLDAIKKFICDKGYAPTVRDLCELTNVKSTSTMQNRLEKLRQKGCIDIVKGSNRTIVVKGYNPHIPVLCRDCRYHHKTNMGVAVWTMCHRLNRKTDDDFYCAYGEEK